MRGTLRQSNRTFDRRGEFKERFKYYDITGTSYTFDMERNYDDGVTWTHWSHNVATKIQDGA